MKIIFTTDTVQRGGKERQLFVLSSFLNQKGYDIYIVSLKYTPVNFINEYKFDPGKILFINENSRKKRFLKFIEITRSVHPDIVFSWDFETSVFNLVLYRKLRYIFINGCIQHGIRPLKIGNILRSVVCWLSPFVVANSHAGLKANNLKPGQRVFVLNNGIEGKFQKENTKENKRKNRTLFLPQYYTCIVFVSVANFLPYKDYFTVLQALSKLKQKLSFYYIIIGDGPMRPEIERKIAHYGLQENIFLAGRTDNVKDYLFASDILIHSSRGEGISNAVLEGMYAGLPVIATNVGGIPETVYAGSSMLFPYRDSERLYNCLLRSQELINSFDPQSDDYRKHLDKFSAESMLKRFEEILEKVRSK